MKRKEPRPKPGLEWWVRWCAVPVMGLTLLWAAPYWGWDAISYWAPDPIGRYAMASQSLEGVGAFRYSPVAALPVIAFGLLPWPVFLVLWTILLVGAVAWLVGPRWLPVALALPPIVQAVALGNVAVLTPVVLVVMLRYPAAILLPILTKASPTGIVWFLARGEWRRLLPVALIGAVLVLVSAILLPGAWPAWFDSLRAEAGMVETWPILLVASLVVVYAARTDRPWLMPFALLLGLRIGWSSLVILLAVPRLYVKTGGSHSVTQPNEIRMIAPGVRVGL